MADQLPPSDRSGLFSAIHTIAGNRVVQILAFVFIAFEIYNTAILPAIRGTIELSKLSAEARTANTLARPSESTPPQAEQSRQQNYAAPADKYWVLETKIFNVIVLAVAGLSGLFCVGAVPEFFKRQPLSLSLCFILAAVTVASNYYILAINVDQDDMLMYLMHFGFIVVGALLPLVAFLSNRALKVQ
ncbi:hypothetical protein [Hyphomicrobium sp.]|uniref:hypothetical protein n=1 Tax=Hyphomicrobium sp. TaxID=82 RepID=UPI00356A5DD9